MDEACRIVVNLRENQEAALQWLLEGGWCRSIGVAPGMSESWLRRLVEAGMRLVPGYMAHPESRRLQYGDAPWAEDLGAFLNPVIEAAGRPQDVDWILVLEEDSAGVAFPQELLRKKPLTHAAALELFTKRLEDACAEARRFPDVHHWGRCGYAFSAHVLAKSGLEMVLVERTNDDVDDLQTAIAFARGAARQHGCGWGIDLSQWWGAYYGCPTELPDTYFFRNLFLSYFSGAEAMEIEYIGHAAEAGQAKCSDGLGRSLNVFGEFVERLEDRGMPEVPAAIIIPEDNGWITPPYWRTSSEVWSFARIPYRQGDASLDAVFGTAFPGSVYSMQPYPFGCYTVDEPPATPFALSCILPDFSVEPEDVWCAEPPIPFGRFHDRDEAREVLNNLHIDPSPYRPMGDSRWGDIFDVLTDEATSAVLSEYSLLILAGRVRLTSDLRSRLRAYAERGGEVVLCAGIATPEDADLTGLAMEPVLLAGRGWRAGNGELHPDHFLYCPAEAGTDTEVIASAPDGAAITTRHAVGKGAVYTCTIPWYAGAHRPLAGAAEALLDRVVGARQPVLVRGLPLEWLSTRGEGHRTLVMANHDGTRWSGEVALRDAGKANRCTDLLSGELFEPKVSERGLPLIPMTVPPGGLRMLRWYLD